MRNNILLIISILGIVYFIALISAYSTPLYSQIDLNLTSAESPPTYDNITLVLDRTTGVSDSCTYTSGNWAINLGDNCTITTDYELGNNNITFTGVGNITFNSKLNATHIGGLPANQKGYIGINGRIKILK